MTATKNGDVPLLLNAAEINNICRYHAPSIYNQILWGEVEAFSREFQAHLLPRMPSSPLNGAAVIRGLLSMGPEMMVEIIRHLETLAPHDLYNLLSKTQVLRALTTMAVQEKKFPLTK